MARLKRLSISIDRQSVDFDTNQEAGEAASIPLSERLAQIHEDHYRLRKTTSALPSRGGLRALEVHIGERIEALAARFDRAIENRGI